MKIEFVLLASGHITTPRISHAVMVQEGNVDAARAEAIAVVKELSKGGRYHRFDLFDVREETHVCIGRFDVEIPEPIVTLK